MPFTRLHTNTIQREIHTTGQSPLLVQGSDYRLYVAKHSHGKTTALINECLASEFLAKWQINKPDFAIMDMDLDILAAKQAELSNGHKTSYYVEPCYASLFVENALDVSAFITNVKREVFNKITNPVAITRIALFDLWIENDDRRASNYNLIAKPINNKFEILPIDHAFVFSTLEHRDLNPKNFSPSSNEHLLDSELGQLIKKYLKIDKEFVKHEKDYFYVCINSCLQYFDLTLQEIIVHYPMDEAIINKIKLFLFDEERNLEVFDEHVFRLTQ